MKKTYQTVRLRVIAIQQDAIISTSQTERYTKKSQSIGEDDWE